MSSFNKMGAQTSEKSNYLKVRPPMFFQFIMHLPGTRAEDERRLLALGFAALVNHQRVDHVEAVADDALVDGRGGGRLDLDGGLCGRAHHRVYRTKQIKQEL